MLKKTMLCTSIVMNEIQLDRFGEGQRIRWKMLSGTNDTGATTTIEVGWKRGREWYPFRGGAAAAANRCIRLFGDVCLPSEFIPAARFYVAAVGDVLVLTAAGEVEPE